MIMGYSEFKRTYVLTYHTQTICCTQSQRRKRINLALLNVSVKQPIYFALLGQKKARVKLNVLKPELAEKTRTEE